MDVATPRMTRVVLSDCDEFFQVVEETVGLGHVAFQVVDAATPVSHRMNVAGQLGQGCTIGPQMPVVRHMAVVRFKFAVQLASLLLQPEGQFIDVPVRTSLDCLGSGDCQIRYQRHHQGA
jgi:hypothetical protein